MSETTNPTININGNGDTDAYRLGPGEHKVMISYGSGVSASIQCKSGINESHLIDFDPPNGAVSGSDVFVIAGSGVLVFSVTGYSGSNGIRIDIGGPVLT